MSYQEWSDKFHEVARGKDMKNTKQKIDVSGFLKMENEECIKNIKQTSKHTAGEWNLFHQINGIYFLDFKGKSFGSIDVKNPADARLIASAPLMLSALELCKMHLDGHPITKDQALKSINEAIAKATQA